MPKLVNRAKMSTATTGTGAITLESAVDGFQTFAAAGVVDADVVRYVIEEGDNFEIGTGTFGSAGGTLTRTLVESSTGALLNLTGNAVVFVTAAAQDIVQPGDNVSDLTNDAGYTTNAGTVTSITAGTGLTGGTITTTGTVAADIATDANIHAGTASKLVASGQIYTANAPVVTSGTGSFTLAFNAGRVFQRTLTGNSTLANPTNQVAGQSGVIYVIQDATGGRTLSLGADWKPIGGAPSIDTGANKVNVFSYYVRSVGNVSLNYLGAE